MGIMRRNLLLILALFLMLNVRANAAITVEEATDPEYMVNYGHSEAFAEEVVIAKNRALGKPVEPLYERKHNKFVRFWRNMYGYIDPASDTDERLHHDVQMSPSYRDL